MNENNIEYNIDAEFEMFNLLLYAMVKSEIKLTDYFIGLPCMLGDVVGMIVGESENKGSWMEINGVNMYSIPKFATPHGSVFEVGISHLSNITDDGITKLAEYEKDAIENGCVLYGGYITKLM